MTQQPQHFVVWTEIPVRNLDDAIKYYQDVLGIECEINDMGPNKTAMFKVQVSPPIAMPFGRFTYTIDPDGNSIGLFEAA